MKHKIILSVVLISLCFIVSGLPADNQPEKKVMNFIAVMDLTCGPGIDKSVCKSLTDVIIDELVKVGTYTVIDRANRDKILSEQGFQQTGCVEESCTVDAGRLLGVGKIVVGSLTKIGETYLVNLQLINVQTAAVETSASERCKCDLDGLIDTVINATRKLFGKAPAQPQPQPRPTAPVTPPQPSGPKPEEIKFIPTTPEQQKLCPPDMVYVPAGWFMMGCNAAKDSQCQGNEVPYHPVYLDAYCIDKYEYPNQAGVEPKAKVNWQDAQGMCSSLGKKLPTEAEWEKAARGTDGRKYPWGEGIDPSKALYGKVFGSAEPSGSREVNRSPYGAYDMAGNLWEWVSDWYDLNYYQNSPSRNPTGPTSGQHRVLRGGSWNVLPSDLRASYRFRGAAGIRYADIGFRCARTP